MASRRFRELRIGLETVGAGPAAPGKIPLTDQAAGILDILELRHFPVLDGLARETVEVVYSFNYYWRMLFKQRWIRRRLLLTLSIHHAMNMEETTFEIPPLLS